MRPIAAAPPLSRPTRPMNSLVSVLHAVRSRLELPGRVSDAQILELALADGLFGSGRYTTLCKVDNCSLI